MTSVQRVWRPAVTASPGWRGRSRVLGLGLIVAVGLSACVEVPPGPAYEPEISVGVGFYQPTYPNMVLVPGYPVYYYPYGNANYFFYDGMYWLYQGDRWYSSGWYNGPWNVRGPHYVPHYLLQVPVRYYRAPPPYFRGWRADEPPHWGEHWGHDWEERHQGWSDRDRRMPPPAPLPRYQGAYAGNRYPHDRDQQDSIRGQNYRYEPRDSMTRPQYQPSGRPSHPQPQEQRAPQYQPPHEQGEWQQRYQPGSAPQSRQPQEQQNEERAQQSQVRRPPPPTPQPQPLPGYRQPAPSTPPQTQPNQQRNRESPPPHEWSAPPAQGQAKKSPPPVGGQPSHPAPQHPQATRPPHESSAPPAQGHPKKLPPPPDKSGDREDDRR